MNTYENNLIQLKAKFPEVYEWMLSEDEDSRVEVIRTESGVNNLRIKRLQGKSIYLEDMNDPLKQEQDFCKDMKFLPDGVTFLIGIGLGYIVETVKEKMQKGHKIIVFEKNATVLRKALAQTDFSELLKDNSIIFSLPDDESIKINVVKYASNLCPDDVILIANKRLMTVSKEYLELGDMVDKLVGTCMVSTMTTLRNAQIFANNEIDNFPKFLFSFGIRNLFSKFEKVPGIIISAGPSLEKNVHKLKQAEGKALLIATAPVVRVLLAHDIKPDLMVSIDFNENNRIHFEGICDRLDIPLVYPMKLAPNIVRDFQGDMFVIEDIIGLSRHLHKKWDFKGYISGGGSVAIFALTTALVCGCDPIIFVGQDLAFSDKSHASGVHMCENVDPKEQFLWVDGIYGDRLPTSTAFVGFRRAIEQIIDQSDRTFVNSTEGGANIEGTEVIPLQESIDRYCKDSVGIEVVINGSKTVERVDFAGLIRDLETKTNEIRAMKKLCLIALKGNKKIRKRIAKGLIEDPETDKIIIDNYNTSTRLQNFCESFAPLSTFLSKEIYQINRQEYKHSGLKRNKLILSAAHRALKEVRTRLSGLLWILKKIEGRRKKLDSNDTHGEAHYLYGKALGEIGLHKLATEEYKKALELGQDDFDIFYDLGLSHIHLGKLSKAEEYFGQGRERAKDDHLIKKGYEQIEEIKNRWLEKSESYLRDANWVNALLYARKLVREYPANRRAQEIVKETETLRDEKVRMVAEANERERTQRHMKEEHQRLIEQARESLNKKEYQRAIDYLEKAFELDHDQDEVNTLLACCYSEMGNIDKAKRLFEELSAKFPKSGLFHLNLGRAFIRNRHFMEAANELELAVSKEKKYYYVLFEAGAIYMNSKDYDKAIECFDRYLEMGPDSYELLAKIGTCYLAKGMLRKAKYRYQQALRIQPGYEPAEVGLRKIEDVEQHAKLKQMAVGSQDGLEA